ncbi:hypothetical protein ASPCADRAFT_212075 [Aspergillus carbonarius ITEM 5010]|uniref:Uncharacterized protein n=1 Tax=Aspergillus carbonarius (strain ITEM 5010) TaxID=602072 RepID=A0A1R3R748_ASPC5|nr:hypothetical protein ASPCADRAFT_212075 [Aspergillus carbonarius ITEM 5010]
MKLKNESENQTGPGDDADRVLHKSRCTPCAQDKPTNREEGNRTYLSDASTRT